MKQAALSPQQDLFAQLVASGHSQTDAYRVAYPRSRNWKAEALYPRASRVAAYSKVCARINGLRAEIQMRAVADAAVDKAYILRRLKIVAERCLQAAPVLDKKGNPVMIETATGELAPAFVFNPMGANRALELLGKEIG